MITVVRGSHTPLEQLKILQGECKRRIDNDNYQCIIEDLILLFEADCSLVSNIMIITEYRNNLLLLIQELRDALQKMKFGELEHCILLNSSHPSEIHYHLSKIYECLRRDKCDPRFAHHVEVIGDFLRNYITVDSGMDDKELFLLIQAGLYNYSIRSNTQK